MADVVISYVFSQLEDSLADLFTFKKIFRDDGLLITKPGILESDIHAWFKLFEIEAEALSGLQFTYEVAEVELNFLDVSIWIERGCIRTKVFIKPNQKLKYLNGMSHHPAAQKRNIGIEVAKRLARLTSINRSLLNMKIFDFYKDHKIVLVNSRLNLKDALNSKFKDFIKDEADESKKKVGAKGKNKHKNIFM